jgi:hypothetical protein
MSAPPPTTPPVTPPTGGDKDGKGKTPAPTKPPEKIPLPNYSDPVSRSAYALAFRNKYGKESLTGYGDIPLRINEKPQWGTDTSKNLAVKYASGLGLDPALFYSSSMIEGQSGLYPGAVKGVAPGQVQYTGDKDFPVSGLWNFGLDSFEDYLPTLKKKGYLPQDFDKNFKIWDKGAGAGGPGGAKTRDEGVMFKNADAGIQAKAAMMKAYYDELDDYAKSKNIKLNPEQRDFFALAHFNSGAHGYQLLDAYNKAGVLRNNNFLTTMPNVQVAGVSPALHKQIYGNVSPRLAAARGLKGEGYFENAQAQPIAAQAAPAQQQAVAPPPPVVRQRPIPEGAKVIETSEGKGYIDPHNGNFVKL